MTTAQLIIVCLTVLLLAGAGLVPTVLPWFASRAATRPSSAESAMGGPELGTRIALHKLDGQAVEGVLEERTPDGDFVLSQVRIYSGPGAAAIDAPGRWTVLASRVEVLQEL